MQIIWTPSVNNIVNIIVNITVIVHVVYVHCVCYYRAIISVYNADSYLDTGNTCKLVEVKN